MYPPFMSKRFWILISCTSIVCLFVGWCFGRFRPTSTAHQETQVFLGETETVHLIDQKLAEGGSLVTVLRCIDAGQVGDAEFLLRVRQAGDILVINDLVSSAPESSRRTATNLFKMIAANYVDRLSTYHGKFGNADTNSIAQVKSILEKYGSVK